MIKQSDELKQKNKRIGMAAFLFVCFMVGVSFAAVPLYDLFCRVTGFGGTPLTADQNTAQIIDRKVRIRFDANTHRDLPWQFGPEVREVKVNIGQDGLINFKAKNTSNTPVTGTALFNVTPLKAGKYFIKTQCFCFEEQRLNPGQSINMPVVFFVDPKIAQDPTMDDVSVITLSYSFFKTDSPELENAVLDQ